MFTRVKNVDVDMIILASNIKMATTRLSSNLSCAKYVVADKIEESKTKREAKKQERKENKEEKAPKEKKVKFVKEEKPKKSKEEKKQEKETKKAENEAKKQERKEKRQEKKEKVKEKFKKSKDSKPGSKTNDKTKTNVNVTVDVDDNIKEVIIDENGDIIVEAKIVDDSPENKKSSMLNQDEDKLVQGVTYGPDFSEFIVDEETDTEKEPEEKPVTQADLDAAIKKMLENGVK